MLENPIKPEKFIPLYRRICLQTLPHLLLFSLRIQVLNTLECEIFDQAVLLG